jgi:uncharacterized membrane protein
MYVPLLFAYPLLIHLAVLWHRPWLQYAAVVCAYSALFFQPLKARRRVAWLGMGLVAVGDFALINAGDGMYALYAPSVIVPSLALSAFAPSLLPMRVPLITRIADSIGGPLSPQQIRYTRAVTWVWTVVIGAVLLMTLGLLLFGSVQAWSLFANFLSYLVLGALFVGEYAYRRIKFPEHAPADFRAFLRSMASYRPL